MTDAERNGDPDDRAPRQGKRNILITSALPYVNNVPHLGNIVGSVLSGDVFARYCRLRDYQVLYIGGTDEYGTATETKAIEEKCTPQEICDKYHKLHASVYEWFKLSFNYFGRTTTEKQTELTQEIFAQLNANGYLKPKSTDQLFCEQCSRFLADRFVNGTCPFCQYDDARGDQCEKCGKPMMDARDLKQPKCKLCKSEPVVKSSEHMFFHLDMIEPKLKQWFESISQRSAPLASLEGDSGENHTLTNRDTHWTAIAKGITAGWFKEGLKPRPITRDLKWGTKVPLPGYENKVFYVWFDAPIGYLSITANYTPHWKTWWQSEDVELFQFLGKDNVPFHSIMFPATLMATGEPWKLVDHICAVEYLNYENGKFSKSRGHGVFGSDVQETGIPADIWRFYLMYIRPESQDSSFCWDDFREKVNSELLNNLGNFINRSLTFVYKNFDATLKTFEPNEDEDRKYMNEIGKHLTEYVERLERVQLRDGLKPILAIGRAGNLLIQANKPWVLIKGSPEDQARAQTVLYLACNTVALIALLLAPYMPQNSETIRTQLAMSTDKLIDVDTSSESSTFMLLLPVGHRIGTPSPLFTKIEADQVKSLKAKFSSK